MLAAIAPAGLVVWVASKARSSLARSRSWVRASTSALCVLAGSVLCALVTIASAPAVIACGGRPGWNPR